MMAKNNHASLRRSSSHWSRLVRGGVIRFGFYFLLCALSFVFLYPFIKMITQSLMTDDDLINITVKWLPSQLTWSNYAVAYRKLMFKSYVWNSARVAIICTLGHVLSCAMTGYAFARYKFRFKGALFAMVILTMLVPVQTVIIPQYMQFSNWGWLNSEYYLPLVVPSFLGFGLNGAFFIFLFRQFFSGMPYEMEEAARVDGCGPIRTFLHIMLPMSQSSLLVCTVLSIVWHWNDYFEPGVYFNSVWLHEIRRPHNLACSHVVVAAAVRVIRAAFTAFFIRHTRAEQGFLPRRHAITRQCIRSAAAADFVGRPLQPPQQQFAICPLVHSFQRFIRNFANGAVCQVHQHNLDAVFLHHADCQH